MVSYATPISIEENIFVSQQHFFFIFALKNVRKKLLFEFGKNVKIKTFPYLRENLCIFQFVGKKIPNGVSSNTYLKSSLSTGPCLNF
jgi:hypothetical protein